MTKTAKQAAAQERFRAAAKQAKREGKKGKSYARRVGELLRGRGSHGGGQKTKLAKRSSGGSSMTSSKGRKVGWAASYQATKTAAQIFSPLVVPFTRLADGTFNSAQVRNDLQVRLTDAPIRSRYARGLAVTIIDAWGSRKIRHTQALAQKSVTAAAPEVYALGTALADNNLDPTDTFSSFVETTTGFDPQGTGFSTRGRLRTYLALKYGGYVVRRVARAVPSAGKPLKKALNLLELTL